jgi:phage antirepressor YoqD-like protein
VINRQQTTLTIADGTQNDHASVILLVRKYIDDLNEFGLVDFKSESSRGRPTEYAILNEQQSTLLLTYMRNSDVVRDFKKKLVKAFWQMAQQLKSQVIDPMKALSDPAIMRGLLLTYTEKVITLEIKVEELAPKAKALDLISADKDSLTLTEVSKILGVKLKDLTARLHAEGWIYRLNGAWVAYDKYIKNGCLAHKEAKYTDENTGLECRKPYCHVTPKGLTKLARMFLVELEPI